jgi:hypothetical protein
LVVQYIIRKAFDCNGPDGKPYLPDSILWRQKEQFSDGVGYSWIDGMKEYAESAVSDDKFAKAGERWSLDTPFTKEAYWIRETFESEPFLFPFNLSFLLLLWSLFGHSSVLLSAWFGSRDLVEHFPTEAAAKTAVRFVPRPSSIIFPTPLLTISVP